MVDVPDDFPRGFAAPTTVSGAQQKFMARKIDGRFVVELTKEEFRAHWLYCEDLAPQLSDRNPWVAAAQRTWNSPWIP